MVKHTFLLFLYLSFLSFSPAKHIIRAEQDEYSLPTRRTPSGWTLAEYPAPHPEAIIQFRVALKQQNVAELERIVLQNSDPASPSYGKHLTKEQVMSLITSPSAVDRVRAWLERAGVSDVVLLGDSIKVSASVSVVETLLQVRLATYTHTSSGRMVIRSTTRYTLPAHLSQDIDIITGLLEFPSIRRKSTFRTIADPVVDQDAGFIVPALLQALYNIPTEYKTHQNSSLCVVEFLDDASYSDADLAQFAYYMSTAIIKPIIVGPFSKRTPDGESTLDVQYAGAIGLNTTLWFWTVEDWLYEFAADAFNAKETPWVISMSWGWPEDSQCDPDLEHCNSSSEYVQRVNTEYLKLSAIGVTILAASGDQGAPGDSNFMCSNTSYPLSNLFPASSPWVTAVGATMLVSSSSKIQYTKPPACKQYDCAENGVEVACSIPEALITTGGGFSTYFSMPSWQANFVNTYTNSSSPLPVPYFNMTNRAYPDISVAGHNYLIHWKREILGVDGTSCSAPVLAGMIALLNSARFNAGKSSLGFINPLLYSAAMRNPEIYVDIVDGNNKCTEFCCSDYGFENSKGWDPVTGLGTPKFDRLLKFISALP